MKKDSKKSVNASRRLLNKFMPANLEELSSSELIDLFIKVTNQFLDAIQNGAATNDLDSLQLEIATIKDEIHRKQHLSPESTLRNNFFYTSVLEKS
jgi:hypothetical protein